MLQALFSGSAAGTIRNQSLDQIEYVQGSMTVDMFKGPLAARMGSIAGA